MLACRREKCSILIRWLWRVVEIIKIFLEVVKGLRVPEVKGLM